MTESKGQSGRDVNWFYDRLPTQHDTDPQTLRAGDWSLLSIEAMGRRSPSLAALDKVRYAQLAKSNRHPVGARGYGHDETVDVYQVRFSGGKLDGAYPTTTKSEFRVACRGNRDYAITTRWMMTTAAGLLIMVAAAVFRDDLPPWWRPPE